MTIEGRTIRVSRVHLAVVDDGWPAAENASRAIAAHWERRSAENAGLFDGTIFMMRRFALDEDCLRGEFLQSSFAAFLAWRERVFEDREMRDSFGVAVIRAADGAVVLGRQRGGQLNSGLAYPPAGFIDPEDVRGGMIDIDNSIAREVLEETGLDVSEFARHPGYLVTSCGAIMAIAIEWRAPLGGVDLLHRVQGYIGSVAEAELARVLLARRQADLEHLPMPDYARALVMSLLPS
jgi:8-oxo-dGTP pyrophosphatase MutT (NUDIX family)